MPETTKGSDGKLSNAEVEELLHIVNTPQKLSKLKELLDEEPKKQKSVNDWYREFEKAERVGYFPEHCKRSALNWGCCAIGARLQIEFPEMADESAKDDGEGYTSHDGHELTDEATDLGRRFYTAVDTDQVQSAKKIFNEIHTLPRIFKTEEEMQADEFNKLPFYKKWGKKHA